MGLGWIQRNEGPKVSYREAGRTYELILPGDQPANTPAVRRKTVPPVPNWVTREREHLNQAFEKQLTDPGRVARHLMMRGLTVADPALAYRDFTVESIVQGVYSSIALADNLPTGSCRESAPANAIAGPHYGDLYTCPLQTEARAPCNTQFGFWGNPSASGFSEWFALDSCFGGLARWYKQTGNWDVAWRAHYPTTAVQVQPMPSRGVSTRQARRQATKTATRGSWRTATRAQSFFRVSVEPSNPTTPPPPPTHVRTPPGRGTKEKKAKMLSFLAKVLDEITEWIEYVDCFDQALPPQLRHKPTRRGHRTSRRTEWDKWRNVYTNFQYIDVESLLQCLVLNEIEDKIAGRVAGKVQLAKKNLNLSTNPTINLERMM